MWRQKQSKMLQIHRWPKCGNFVLSYNDLSLPSVDLLWIHCEQISSEASQDDYKTMPFSTLHDVGNVDVTVVLKWHILHVRWRHWGQQQFHMVFHIGLKVLLGKLFNIWLEILCIEQLSLYILRKGAFFRFKNCILKEIFFLKQENFKRLKIS